MTITEGLAEIKTINKRLQKKREFVLAYLAREERVKDPFAEGSAEKIRAEQQAMDDLADRILSIRQAIHKANANTTITLAGRTMTIANWLTWRREIAPDMQAWHVEVNGRVQNIRRGVMREGKTAAGPASNEKADVIINVNEAGLAKAIEDIEQALGELDGQLSLKNATVTLDLEDVVAL